MKRSVEEIEARCSSILSNHDFVAVVEAACSPTAAYQIVFTRTGDLEAAKAVRWLAILRRDYPDDFGRIKNKYAQQSHWAGIKSLYVGDINKIVSLGNEVTIYCWLKSKRNHSKVIFLDVCDSTGCIQAVVDFQEVGENTFNIAREISIESAIIVTGVLTLQKSINAKKEIQVHRLDVINRATKIIAPAVRGDIDIFDHNLADHLLANRHLYIRNEKVMAILRFRHIIMSYIRQWFDRNNFIEITAPVLTMLPLYDDKSVLSLEIDKETVYLTQCVGFYLESATHAFERVYNMGPSFRGEESRSKRHLMEYWHIKAELAFGNLEGIISIVEQLLSDTTTHLQAVSSGITDVLSTNLCLASKSIPFPRITYREAVERLRQKNHAFKFGKSLSSEDEAVLSQDFDTPFWVVGIPRTIEPFPYVVDVNDPELTKTADLIASNGYGELLGVAEKIYDLDMLDERMHEKGKSGDCRYNWVRELREYGCVPHVGFGMGVERLIRWLLDIPHVRDAMPFPRTFKRKIYP